MTFTQRLKQLAAGATPTITDGGTCVSMTADQCNARNELHAYLVNNALAIAAAIEAAQEVDRIGIGAHLQLHAALSQLAKD